MNGLYTGFHAVLVNLCILLLPLIALASDNASHSALKSIAFSVGLIHEMYQIAKKLVIGVLINLLSVLQ